MPRFEGNLRGVLDAFLATHPDYRAQQFVTDQAGYEGEWISIPLVREATRWARQQRFISWEMATTLETICRCAEDTCAAMRPESHEDRHQPQTGDRDQEL
jgi:hypothetical protein